MPLELEIDRRSERSEPSDSGRSWLSGTESCSAGGMNWEMTLQSVWSSKKKIRREKEREREKNMMDRLYFLAYVHPEPTITEWGNQNRKTGANRMVQVIHDFRCRSRHFIYGEKVCGVNKAKRLCLSPLFKFVFVWKHKNQLKFQSDQPGRTRTSPPPANILDT